MRQPQVTALDWQGQKHPERQLERDQRVRSAADKMDAREIRCGKIQNEMNELELRETVLANKHQIVKEQQESIQQ